MFNNFLSTSAILFFLLVACDSKDSSTSTPQMNLETPTGLQLPPPFPAPTIRAAGRYFLKKNQWRLLSSDMSKSISTSALSWCEFDGANDDTCNLHEWRHIVQDKKRMIVVMEIPNVRKVPQKDLPQFYKSYILTDKSTLAERQQFLKIQRQFSYEWNTLEVKTIAFSEKFDLHEINLSQLIQHYYQTYRCRGTPMSKAFAQMCPSVQGNYLVQSSTFGGLPHYFKNANLYLEIDPQSGEIQSAPLVLESPMNPLSLGALPYGSEDLYNSQNISSASGYKPSVNDLIKGAKNPAWANEARSFSNSCDAAYSEVLKIYEEIISTPYTPSYSADVDQKASVLLSKDLSENEETSLYSEFGESFSWTGKDPGLFPQPYRYFIENKTFKDGACGIHFNP